MYRLNQNSKSPQIMKVFESFIRKHREFFRRYETFTGKYTDDLWKKSPTISTYDLHVPILSDNTECHNCPVAKYAMPNFFHEECQKCKMRFKALRTNEGKRFSKDQYYQLTCTTQGLAFAITENPSYLRESVRIVKKVSLNRSCFHFPELEDCKIDVNMFTREYLQVVEEFARTGGIKEYDFFRELWMQANGLSIENLKYARYCLANYENIRE